MSSTRRGNAARADAPAGTAAADTGPRILKKYPNRRLYDTRTSSYITLVDVKQMVLDGENFEVRDAKTGAVHVRLPMGHVQRAAFDPSGRFLLLCQHWRSTLWDLDANAPVAWTWQSVGTEQGTPSFSRDGKRGLETPSLPAQPFTLLSSVWSCSGMSESSSSSTSFCECSARGELVVTSMPGVGKRQQEGASARSLARDFGHLDVAARLTDAGAI